MAGCGTSAGITTGRVAGTAIGGEAGTTTGRKAGIAIGGEAGATAGRTAGITTGRDAGIVTAGMCPAAPMGATMAKRIVCNIDELLPTLFVN